MTTLELIQLQNEHKEKNYEDEYYNKKEEKEQVDFFTICYYTYIVKVLLFSPGQYCETVRAFLKEGG